MNLFPPLIVMFFVVQILKLYCGTGTQMPAKIYGKLPEPFEKVKVDLVSFVVMEIVQQ
jgi:hypothetical protein